MRPAACGCSPTSCRREVSVDGAGDLATVRPRPARWQRGPRPVRRGPAPRGARDAALAEAGITAALYAVYSQLVQGQQTPRQLSDTLGVRPTTLSGYLATMEASGHVTRARNQHDGRSSVLSLTESGRAKVEQCRPLMRRALKTVHAELGSAHDVRAARPLLARIDDAIQAAHRRLPPTQSLLTSTTSSFSSFVQMRRIINSTYVTLDGVIQDPQDWPSLGGLSDAGSQVQPDLLESVRRRADGPSHLRRRSPPSGRPARATRSATA